MLLSVLATLTSQWKCKPETGSPNEMMQAMLSTSAICKEKKLRTPINQKECCNLVLILKKKKISDILISIL